MTTNSPQCKDKDESPQPQNQKHVDDDGDTSSRMNLGKAFAKLTAIDSDQPQQAICQVCAIQESQCQEIKQCSGCNVSTYCSRSCQRVDWVTHKPDCQALSKVTDSDTIHLYSKDLLNLNACIEYALRNMPNLKHVHLLISEEHKVRDEDCNNYEIKESDAVVQLSPETMSSLLESHKGKLTSFNWDAFDVCECERCVRRLTNKGKLFLSLVDLEILRLDTVPFDNITTLQTIIHLRFELAAIVEGLGGRMAIYNYDIDSYLDVTSNLSSEAALQNRKVIPAVVKSSVAKISTLKLEKSGRLAKGGSNALKLHYWPNISIQHRFYTLLGVD